MRGVVNIGAHFVGADFACKSPPTQKGLPMGLRNKRENSGDLFDFEQIPAVFIHAQR